VKKHIIIYLFLLSLSTITYAQNATAPSFPGGDKAFHEFLSKNLKWPDSSNVHGVVTVVFYVEKDGKLTNIRVAKKLSPAYDKEALRLMSISPKWIPATQQNKLIRSAYTVPISFTVKVNEAPSRGLPDGYIPVDVKVTEEDPNKIYTSAEKVPTFPGGYQKFQEYIAETLKKEKLTSADAGRVYIAFVVERDGSLTDIRVVRGVSQKSDVAALRLFKSSPKWMPAMMNGHPIRFANSYPIEIKPNN
jgi:TonB family protein